MTTSETHRLRQSVVWGGDDRHSVKCYHPIALCPTLGYEAIFTFINFKLFKQSSSGKNVFFRCPWWRERWLIGGVGQTSPPCLLAVHAQIWNQYYIRTTATLQNDVVDLGIGGRRTTCDE
ncbi:hypothetical protein J1614_005218 [Plenodomus biglobosus]|nr:hypothetical protein J1614_005218 [Plenodomus biglobosus]